jgi:hypothetical protein
MGRFFDNAGHRRRFLFAKYDRGYLAVKANAGDTGPKGMLLTRWRKGLGGWSLYDTDGSHEGDSYVGRVVKRSGRWYAQTMGDFYHDMGSVSAGAPAWVASGSVYCLHKWWWTWP